MISPGSRAWCPDVGAQVMVIATGRQKQRSRVAPHGLVEPERAMVERFGVVKVADVQVDVAHRRVVGAPSQVSPRPAAITLVRFSGSVVITSSRSRCCHAARGRSA